MAEKPSYALTIAQVVKSFQNERGEKTLTNFERYMQMALEGFSDMNVFEINSIEVVYLTIDPETMIAELPADFITMTKMGININGKMWTLTVNNDILLPPPSSICDIEPAAVPGTQVITDPIGGYYFAPHYNRSGRYVDTLYGVGGGFNTAYYRIDMSRRIIYFQGRIPNNEVILEYKSSGIKGSGTIVPRQAVPALKAYLHWKSTEYDGRISMGEKMRKENLYDKELVKLTQLENSFTVSEFLDTMYSTYSQTVKR
jgi:hypothetical protein